ncbi:MAG TPA: GNAT family N-acetyltransferase [Candidatus Bathyarchaeota archaeon]|nr:GNAT family N-acetyltransferase [Candidatus Bathyarchaeota archaeon]
MKVIDNPNTEVWQEIVDRCEYATFFHTPAWARILVETYPRYRIATKLFLFDDGTRIILPLIELKACKGILRSYISMPFGVYGGIISDDKINAQKIKRVFEYVSQYKFTHVRIFGNPYYDYKLPDKYQVRDYFTQLLRIEQGFEFIWRNYKYSVRKQVKKAERNGVYVKLAGSLEEYKEYFKIYQLALERWGEKATSRYEFDLFKKVYEIAGEKAKLWLVCHQKIVGGTLVFYHNWHSVEWHAAFDSNYFKLGIRNFLVNEIIKDAIQRGFKIYDFNPSGGHEGVVRFKESFGAEKRFFKVWSFESKGYKILQKGYSLYCSKFR